MVDKAYVVDPGDLLGGALQKALKRVDDLTIPYKLMAREWYKGNRSIFDEGRKSKGKYADLSPRYKKIKTRYLGSPYPILRGFLKPAGRPARKSGKLARSMTDSSNADTVNTIINKRVLVLGTKVKTKKGAPYAVYLHKGTKTMPARPYVLVGGEQVATPQINKRRDAWVKRLEDFVIQVSKGTFAG